jgi:hypothetical protein
MLAARAKERRRTASKMLADGSVAARSATKISACPASRQLARLYNLSRRFEGVSSMDLRRLRLIGDRVPLEGASSALAAGAVVTGGQTLQ